MSAERAKSKGGHEWRANQLRPFGIATIERRRDDRDHQGGIAVADPRRIRPSRAPRIVLVAGFGVLAAVGLSALAVPASEIDVGGRVFGLGVAAVSTLVAVRSMRFMDNLGVRIQLCQGWGLAGESEV